MCRVVFRDDVRTRLQYGFSIFLLPFSLFFFLLFESCYLEISRGFARLTSRSVNFLLPSCASLFANELLKKNIFSLQHVFEIWGIKNIRWNWQIFEGWKQWYGEFHWYWKLWLILQWIYFYWNKILPVSILGFFCLTLFNFLKPFWMYSSLWLFQTCLRSDKFFTVLQLFQFECTNLTHALYPGISRE